MKSFAGKLTQELVNILQYWQHNTMDQEYRRFYRQIDHFNHINPLASKGVVLNARILWTFSAAYNFTKNPDYLEIAKRAFEYIREFFSGQRKRRVDLGD